MCPTSDWRTQRRYRRWTVTSDANATQFPQDVHCAPCTGTTRGHTALTSVMFFPRCAAVARATPVDIKGFPTSSSRFFLFFNEMFRCLQQPNAATSYIRWVERVAADDPLTPLFWTFAEGLGIRLRHLRPRWHHDLLRQSILTILCVWSVSALYQTSCFCSVGFFNSSDISIRDQSQRVIHLFVLGLALSLLPG